MAVMSIYKYDSVSELMLFNGIWTGFFATPYLTIAPLKFPRFAHYVVEPLVEISAFILWLVGVILLGIALPPTGQCTVAGCEAMLAAVVLAALEWYVLSLSSSSLLPIPSEIKRGDGKQLLTLEQCLLLCDLY